MDPQARASTRLKYRFSNLWQAQAHVRDIEGRPLFFYRDDKLRLLPFAPVCVEFSFDDGAAARLLHGWALDSIEGSGTWLQIRDTRPIRNRREFTRMGRRLGCDLPVEVRAGERARSARMLDLSEGGARIDGIPWAPKGEAVEIRLPSPDGLTFRDLSFAHVAWAQGEQIGVRFDPADLIGRSAVVRLLRETVAVWKRVYEASHPRSCCEGRGVFDPEPPRLPNPEDSTGKIARSS